MYRSAPRYDSRPILENPTRSARATWNELEDRSYASAVDVDDSGLSRDPYLSGDALRLDTEFPLSKTTSNDLREAQRLAASFFSQYPPSSTSAPPAYRDMGRSTRPISPEVPMERYSARDQYRDPLEEERWGDRSSKEALYTSRSQVDWEEGRIAVDRRERMDVYGVSAAPVPRGRSREDGGWDDYDYGMIRKEIIDYPVLTEPEGLRVTKRLDWTGLLQPDGGRGGIGMSLDTSMSKRASQTYGGGRHHVDAYRNDLVDEFNPIESVYCRREDHYGNQYGDLDVRKERGYLDERLHEREEYGVGSNVGSSRDGRGSRGRDEWGTEPGSGLGRGNRGMDSERGRGPSRYENERDSRRTLYSGSRDSVGGSGSGRDIGRNLGDVNPAFRRGKYDVPKRDFSNRASITNRDILAVYYGNQGEDSLRKFGPRRSFPSSGPFRYDSEPRRSEKWRPALGSRPPFGGKPVRYDTESLDPLRKGKRWERSTAEVPDVKRFKKETKSDKLFLMHNIRATTEEKEKEGAEGSIVKEAEKDKAVEENMKEAVENDNVRNAIVEGTKDASAGPSNGLWDNDDSWSDSEGEGKASERNWVASSTNVAPSSLGLAIEARQEAAFQSLQAAALDDSKRFLGECSEDDDADWESPASDLDDQLDDVCVHLGLENADAIPESVDKLGVVPNTSSEAQGQGQNGTLSVAQCQDSEMVETRIIKEGRVGSEKKKKKRVVVVMEELQESVKDREDKAFDYYYSLFEQDTELRRLYESNINCGSFECLVCSGVGANKKKRFPDVASLVQHAKKVMRTKKLPEHRGLARAVCKILGWEAVTGTSVIPQGGGMPPQVSEPEVLHQDESVKQKGGGVEVLGMDWEWAAARQLFEDQEGRIDTTSSSAAEAQRTGSVIESGSSLMGKGNSYPACQSPGVANNTEAINLEENFSGEKSGRQLLKEEECLVGSSSKSSVEILQIGGPASTEASLPGEVKDPETTCGLGETDEAVV